MNTTTTHRRSISRPAKLLAQCPWRPKLLVLRNAVLPVALLASLALTGCSFLKPAHNPERHFVLTPLPPAADIPASAPALGIGQVKMPAYLFNSSIAVRRGTNEIQYLPLVLWAERLDTSLQRVLAADLAASLPTDKIRLSAWRMEEVNAEVYVSVERLDVDTTGQATLIAWWRIMAPGAEKTLKSGQAQLTHSGPSPDLNPSGAVATMSDLLAELSQQLAASLKQVLPTGSGR